MTISANRTEDFRHYQSRPGFRPRQVDHVPHADPVGDFPQFRAAGREEAAHQTIAAELFQPVLPALGAQTQPLEDPGQLLRDRGFSLAK
jgi:hypothetical protein